jgi:hypothetical protein
MGVDFSLVLLLKFMQLMSLPSFSYIQILVFLLYSCKQQISSTMMIKHKSIGQSAVLQKAFAMYK